MALPGADQISSLFNWSSAASFRANDDAFMEDASDDDLLEKSSETAKSLREAYNLARFAAGIGASDCRLVNDQFPDAEIRTHDKIKKLELTELMAPDRKRSAEYKSGAIYHEPQTLTSGNWIYRFVELVFKKSDYYGHSMHCDLVIDNNQVFLCKLTELPRLHSLLIKEFQTKKIAFDAIWHYRPDKVHCVWPVIEEYIIPNWENDF